MRNICLTILIITVYACSNEDLENSPFPECLEMNGMDVKPYAGEEIKCQFFYTLHTYNNKEYIELNAHCADLSRPFVFNDQCIDICAEGPFDADSECGQYLNGREFVRILYIAE